jgi:hypothetical protein
MDLSPLVLKIEVTDVAKDECAGGYGGVISYGVQDGQVTSEVHLVALGGEDVELVGSLILGALEEELFAGLVREMTVVEVLDGLLEADGDEESEDDGGDVDEEVAPSGGGVVGGVDVEHGSILFRRLWNVCSLRRLALAGGCYCHSTRSRDFGRWKLFWEILVSLACSFLWGSFR